MTQRIIVEGLDGAGKTSLITTIQYNFPTDVIAVPGFKHSGAPDYETWLRHEMNGNQVRPVKLHDRFFYSELIYGTLLRGHIDIGPRVQATSLEIIRSTAFLIYCRIPYSDIVHSVGFNQQMEGVLENLLMLYDAYEEIMQTEMQFYGDRFAVWDFTQHQIKPQVLKPLTQYLQLQ